MTTWAEIRAKRAAAPLEHTEWMVLDPDLRNEWQDASRQFLMASQVAEALRDQGDDEKADAAEGRAAAAEEKLRSVQGRCDEAGVLVGWKFCPVSPDVFEELKRAHPPIRKGEQWAPGFENELISACLLDPKMTIDEVGEMRGSGEWSPAEFNQLLGAALTICQTSLSVRIPGKG